MKCALTHLPICFFPFTPLEIMERCSEEGLNVKIIPGGVNTPLEFLTEFSTNVQNLEGLLSKFSFPSMVHHLNSLVAAMPRCLIFSPLLPATPSPHPLF